MKTETIFRVLLWSLFMATGMVGLRSAAQTDAPARRAYATVSGTVRDTRTNRVLPAVHVAVPGTGVGTVTNADGYFSLHVADSLRADRIEFSHIGYALLTYPIRPGTQVEAASIRLTPNANLLEEVTVMGGDAHDLVRQAVDRITDNYPQRANRLTGFYREVIRKGRRYIDISEAIVGLYKTPYNGVGTNADRVRLEKGRRLLSQRPGDTLIVKFEGGPTLSIFLDVVKNSDLMFAPDEMEHYAFRYNRTTLIDDRPHVEIRFMPRVVCPYALYEGLLYIDSETRTISRAEFSLDMTDRLKATQAMLRKKPAGMRFRPERLAFLVTYRRQANGRSSLAYVRCETAFRCDWHRRLFATSYVVTSEMAITDRDETHAEKIPYREAFRSRDALIDRAADFYDANFWDGYNIIEPTESLENAVGRLMRRRSHD